MKTVADILERKGPQFNVIEADVKVIDALSVMKTENHSYLIVTRNGSYAGIISERDYAQKVLLMGRSSYLTSVGEIMNCNLPTISAIDTVEKCMMLMNAYKTRYLPVFDAFDFKAVVTMNDLIRISMNNRFQEELAENSSEKIF